ncbi:MAG: 2-oxo acid dehydrogenase subunit E2 [Chloroflexi bacterium]|nr:2-oxo acid dehydrogenase subunit E2 [Chloroflexota bacterium]
MAHAVRMPKPGQMTEECVLSMWRLAEGQPVAKGDSVFEIETDKSTMEVESFHDGVLLRQVVEEGATVPVNEIVAWIGQPGEAVPDAELAAEPPAQAEAAAEAEAPVTWAAAEAAVETAAPPPAADRIAISPRARTLARDAGLAGEAITGTGPGGRIVERDVAALIATRAAAAAAAPPAVAARAAQPAVPSLEGEAEPRPLSRMRRVIAERLTLSATTIPTFTATVAADVTRVLELRDELRATGITLSVNDIVLAATAQTLAEFPDVNSRTDGISVWERRRVHLGVAVALPAGLVVAVIRDADRLGILELHEEASRLVAAARDGTLGVDDMTGSTFSVSNLGMYGIDAFSAIINPGESGILAVASAIPMPVVLTGGIAIRTVMKLTLPADHRLVDGELGARFLGALRRRLEDPAAFRRELASG